MSDHIVPSSAALADAPTIDFNDKGTVQIARLITRGSSGSELLTGVCTARPDSVMSWTSKPNSFKTYYVVRGRMTVSWTSEGTEAGSVELGPDEAILLAPGWTFRAEAHEETFIIYSMIPPSA